MTMLKKNSAVVKLLTHVWDNHRSGSWLQLNSAMSKALGLAIESGMRFDRDDCATIYKEFRGGYWFGDARAQEYRWYARACGLERNNHGGNLSAAKSFEAFTGRKPFLLNGRRLCVTSGVTLKNEPGQWEVTSFNDHAHTMVLVTYRPEEEGRPRKILRRMSVTNAEWLALRGGKDNE